MAFLRSGKFFRFLSAGKNLVNFREYETPRPLPLACVCSAQNFATSVSSIPAQSLENSLKRLDQDVRRSGRISRRDLEEILDEIRTNKTATSSQSLLVIRCCGNLVPEELPAARTRMVQEIWKTLSKLNVPMDISHYNALLRVYLENEYAFQPAEFLADLKSKGVEPNRVTYQRLISRYCQDGDINGALQIMEFMREKQLPVNENVFNALIMGHSNVDDFVSAAGILSVMANAGLEPSADTYTILLCGFARKGDLDSINKYVAEAEEKEIMLLDKDFLEVIYTLAANGHSDKVSPIFEKLKKNVGYNQDAVNTILRLVNSGHVDVALKVHETMPRLTRASGAQADTGSFLIRQLVKAKRPVEEVLKICNEFEENGMHTKPILTALEAALTVGNLPLIKALLKEMQARNLEIRPHYFWPAFRACKSEAEVFELCRSMQDDFKVKLTNQTIRDYVLPKIMTDDVYEDAIQKLRNLGASTATAASTAAYHALNRNRIQKAAEIMGSFDSYFSPGLFRKPILSAVSATSDFDSYVKILRHMNDNMNRLANVKDSLKQEEEEEDDEAVAESVPETSNERASKNIQSEVLGDLVIDAVSYFKSNRVEVATKVLQGLVDNGLTISSFKAERIQNRLGDSMTAEISTLLSKLTSGELEPTHIEKTRMQKSSFAPVLDEVQNLERLIKMIEAKGDNPKGLKRQLLVAVMRTKDIEKTQEILERLKGEGYVLSAGIYAQLVELYASCDRLDEALEALKKIRETEPEFALDDIKVVKVAQAFLNADRLDEAVKFLEENKPAEARDEKQFLFQNACWRLLNSIAEKGNVAELNRVFDTMVANNYFVPNNILLGPLIKVHLMKDDLKTAVEKFDEVCQKYRATPWKSELASRLIQAEDAANLQRITDLSSEIHGEVNSLYDLVFSFIECGRVRQARKILEAPGLRTRPGRINVACERYLNEGMPSALEGLAEATKDLSHIDRSEIYFSLLQNYIKDVAPDKALNLWTTMQEEDITPSDPFLIKLAEFLESQGREVPFHRPATLVASEDEGVQEIAAPAAVKSQPKRTQKKAEPTQRKVAASQQEFTETVSALKKALKSEDVDAILQAKQNLTATDKVSLHDRSAVVEALVKAGKLPEATKVVTEVLEDKLTPLPSVFRFYLNRVAATGDTETLLKVGSYLSPEKKRIVSFDNRVCHSYVVGGKSDAYLEKLEEIIDNAKTEEEIKKADEEFPRGGAIGILEERPESVERFHKVATKYAEKKVLGPVNVLWMHYAINHDPKGDLVFKEHLTNAPRLMFQRIIQMARRNEDEKLVQKLIGVLVESKVSEGAVGNAYSCLIDICAAKNNADACLKAVNDCVKAVSFENVNRTALERAKECVEKAGQKFPHKIPDKKTSNQDSSSSSSSSSSDDEVTKKQN